LASARVYGDGLAIALKGHDRLTVVGATIDVGSVVPLATELGADVVLMDASAAGFDVMTVIARRLPAIRIVALGIPETEEAVISCAEAGAAGYVPRAASMTQLAAIVVALSRGEATCSPRIAASLFARLGAVAAANGSTATRRLTRRETEILALVDRGLSNKEIARELHIEVSTVKNHIHNILDKLNARRRGEAVARLRRPDSLHGVGLPANGRAS
jgi:two-component system, NarL family, nitrate/nitrite response regulator NarL